MDPPAWSASPTDEPPEEETQELSPERYEEILRRAGVEPQVITRMVRLMRVDDGEDLERYVALTPTLSTAIDLHGSKARERHVAHATMRSLGFRPSAETSTHTLRQFVLLAEQIGELLAIATVAIEAKARALASTFASTASPGFTDVDLGLTGHTHRASGRWRRVDIENELFVRIRRLLRRLADDENLLIDLTR